MVIETRRLGMRGSVPPGSISIKTRMDNENDVGIRDH